jgi:uncharacterized membrane protein YdbT with pleckstrin-like domain
MAYIDDLLARDEQVRFVGRQHLVVLIGRLVGELLLIGVLVLAGVVSQNAFGSQQVGGLSLGQVVLLTCAAISVLIFGSIVLDYLRWNNTQYIVTDRRVIQTEGVFNKSVIDSSLDKINDVALTQSWLGRILDFGDVEVLTASEIGVNRMDSIASPVDFKQAMMEAKLQFDRGFGYFDPSAVVPYTEPDNIQVVLTELASLRDRGILSTDEFEAKKRELLNRI